MKIRKLQEKDSIRILEWIKDPEVGGQFRFDASKVDMAQVLDFIKKAQETEANIHMAIVDDADKYLGTVSLKNIDRKNQNAEYAIAIHKDAMGKGGATFATEQIIKIAFEELNLRRLYLNVFSDNVRAIAFYERFGFKYEGELRDHVKVGNKFKTLKLFAILNDN